MNHSRLDVAIAVRALSKVMDGVNQAAFLEMYPVIKHEKTLKILYKRSSQTEIKMIHGTCYVLVTVIQIES